MTFNSLTSKAVVKNVKRVQYMPYSEADRLGKLILVVRGTLATLTQMLLENTPNREFKIHVERNNSSHKTWLDKARRVEGASKTYGIHALGLVTWATPLNRGFTNVPDFVMVW